MSNTLTLLSELQLDALTELVNLGISQAAQNLAGMVGEEVTLTVPKVTLLARAEAIRTLADREPHDLVAIHQVFEGEIHGRAMLIFPQAQSLELVRAITGGHLSAEEIVEMELEALAETGNVILNGCLGIIANELQRTLRISLPEVLHGDGLHFFNLDRPPASEDDAGIVMFTYINFALRRRDIAGYIAVVLDMQSISVLRLLLDAYVVRIGGEL